MVERLQRHAHQRLTLTRGEIGIVRHEPLLPSTSLQTAPRSQPTPQPSSQALPVPLVSNLRGFPRPGLREIAVNHELGPDGLLTISPSKPALFAPFCLSAFWACSIHVL